MPPRAADTNEPDSRVGDEVPATGSNGEGAVRPSPGSSKALSAHTPATPAAVPAPKRSAARRVSCGMA